MGALQLDTGAFHGGYGEADVFKRATGIQWVVIGTQSRN